jgi:hypothetical protein
MSMVFPFVSPKILNLLLGLFVGILVPRTLFDHYFSTIFAYNCFDSTLLPLWNQVT